MDKERFGVRLSFRRESLRYGVLTKRAGFLLFANLCTIIFLGSLLEFLMERGSNPAIHSYWNALYMVIITLATVGYGDVVPVTGGGRVTIIIILLFGVVTLSAFITLLATRRAKKTRRRYAGLQDIIKSKGHIVVCGWNPRGRYVINRLKDELEKKHTQIVLLCDLEENPVEDDYVFFLRGNPVSEADLQRANVAEARTAILLADESKGGSSGDVDARTVLTALTIRDFNPEVKMTAEVLGPENVHHLVLVGVGEILDTNSFLGNLIARSALRYGLINTVSDMVAREADTHVFTIPAGGDMLGKTRQEIEDEMRLKHSARMLAIATVEGFRSYDQDYRVVEGDNLLVIAEEPPPGAIT